METNFRQHLTPKELNLADHYVTLGGATLTAKRAKELCTIFNTWAFGDNGKRLPRPGYEMDLCTTKHEKLILKHEGGTYNLRIYTSPNINFP